MSPQEIAGFQILPVILPTHTYKKNVKHFIFVKIHDPNIADENAARSLFLVNIPINTTTTHLRHLFTKQLSAGHVERVSFDERRTQQKGRKRKRLTVEELETNLKTYKLPSTLPSEIHISGAAATVVFIDQASRDSCFKSIRKSWKQPPIWGEGIKDSYGLSRYQEHKTLQYPPREELLRLVENYMTAYGSLEETRTQENAKKRALPDEDGFITVTRGSKGAFKREEAKPAGSKPGLEDFYRFQMREKRRAQQNETYRKFQEDKNRIEGMRSRRGKVMPEG